MPTFEPVDFDPFQRGAIPTEGTALLNAIAGSESPGYDTLYGGGKFSDFTVHPRKMIPITSGPNAGKFSSAAGRYQFLGSTWDDVQNDLSLPDFSPGSQDQAAWHLAQKVYKQKTGRELLGDLQKAKGNPAAVEMIGRYLGDTWTSLPGGIEPNKATGGFGQRYASSINMPTDVSAQSRGPKFEPVDHDPFAEPEKPSTALTEKLGKMWENPAPGGLVRFVKGAYEGAKKIGQAATGEVPIYGDDDRISGDIIKSAADVAMVSPLRAAPGGILGAQTVPKIAETVTREAVTPPTAAALKEAAGAGFESPAIKGLEIAPGALKDFSTNMKAGLNAAGVDDLLAPKTFGILSKFEKSPEAPGARTLVTGDNLQTMRRMFQTAAGSADKTERMAAKRVIDSIDEFIPNIAARDILSGDPKAAAKAWALARGDYAAAMRSEDIARAVLKAQRQAGSAGSGTNIDNATRQQFKSLLNNEKKLRGFSDEEIEQMQSIVQGTLSGNIARNIGKAAPTGIVSAALSGGGGYAALGPYGMVLVPLAGYIGKKLGDRSTAGQVAKLDAMVRSRAPLMKAMEDLAIKVERVQVDGPSARTLSALNLAARNLASNLRDAGISLSPADILRALTGPVKGSAEDEKAN